MLAGTLKNSCKNCKNTIEGDFCSNCGRAKKLRKIDGSYILSEIGSILNFDRGILYTIRELILRPGKNVQAFIHNDRNRLVKPVVFIIISSLIYSLMQEIFNFEDGFVNYSFDADSANALIFGWVTKNYGYANLMMAIFIAVWIKLLYRKQPYNLFEILILLCFIIGTAMLIFTVFGILESTFQLNIIDKGFFIGVMYISWGIGQFFKGHKLLNAVKGFLSYMLGLITFTIALLAIGFAIDWIN